MKRDYHKWYSPALHREMELLVFGHAGTPLIVFPTSMGRFYDYEDRGMIRAVEWRYESGALQAFSLDSVDAESWYNKSVHPRDRVRRHNQYEQYLINEVIPFIRSRNPSEELALTGCSFGGYHVMNLVLRHPDLVTYAVSMGGAFDIKQFLDGYYDDNCYFNNPPDYLNGCSDPWKFNHMGIVLGTGEWDSCRDENFRLSGILTAKGVKHFLDDRRWSGHDW